MRSLTRLASVSILCLGLLALAASCSSESKAPKKNDGKGFFAPIKDANLVLEVVSSRTEFFRDDAEAKITFSLRNDGLKPVTVFEWFAKESNNVRLSYAKCDDGDIDRIPASFWTPCKPPVQTGDYAPRMPLDLYPRNTALVSVPLSDIKELASKGPGKTSFAIKGELNLTSVSAKSKPFLITFK